MSFVPTDPAPAGADGRAPQRQLVKRVLPRTLFGRSLLIILLPALLLQIVTTYVFFDRHWSTITKNLALGVAGEIALVSDAVEHAASEQQIPSILATTARTLDLLISWEPNGSIDAQPLAGWDPYLHRTLSRAMEEKVRRPFRIGSYVPDEWVEIRVQLPDGSLTVLSPLRRLSSYTAYLVVLWMIGASILLSAIALLFMRNQVRPIRRLAAAADSFGKGREVERFKPEGASEVRLAATAFLNMRERLHRQIGQRTEMLAGVSHDLRTPLTRMKLQLAMLPQNEAIEGLATDVVEMESMIEAYLAFARGEGGETSVETDLDQLVAECVQQARRGGREIALASTGPLLLPLKPQAMKRCIDNLIGNALRYAGKVAVTVRRNGNTAAELVIDDDGPGIPVAMREDVFRPFLRLETSRNRATGGVGLGMTIARDVARGHGGEVLLGDSPMGGLRAVVRLPF